MPATKTVNRGWLLRQAKAGRLYVKCSYHYTDDYAYDAANDNGRMPEFKHVYVYEEPHFEVEDKINEAYKNRTTPDPEWIYELQRLRCKHYDDQYAKATGKVMMHNHDFRSSCGRCWGDHEHGTLKIHSNLCYEYEVR